MLTSAQAWAIMQVASRPCEEMAASASKQRKDESWFEQALTALHDSGPAGQASAEYIGRHRIPLGFSHQKHTGASWFDWHRLRRGVFLNTCYADEHPDTPYLYAFLAHEAKHLEQGLVEALSTRGELVAWQLQYDVLVQSSAEPAGRAWRELRTLDPAPRADLKRAQTLMKQIGGPGYHIDWLPLWPLPAELAHQLKDAGRRLFRFLRTG
jgi:hypothetical protein